jgi:two-component system, LytTR family, sensor kinase
MNLRHPRGLLVLATFSLVTVVSAARLYLSEVGGAPSQSAVEYTPAFWALFWNGFRYYLAWAAVAPGIIWLGRRVPFTRQRWRGPLAIHLLVPIAGSGPFFVFRLFLNAALGQGFPPMAVLTAWWPRILSIEALAVLPVYAILLGVGAAVQFQRDYRAKQVQAIELERSLAAAELDALRMSLQPHFLFSTLNSIASLAGSGETDGIADVVERLGRLLRLSMETSGRQFVTLDEELALLGEYLAIEKVRFTGGWRVVRRIDPSARRALVPNLILQPLVENAVVHGLSGLPDSKLLEIVATREGSHLRLVVGDDGPGLPPGWTMASGAGRGLRNVADRVQALYAERGRFNVGTGATGGVIAELRFPFVEMEPEPGEE